MKWAIVCRQHIRITSLPARGAWVEILKTALCCCWTKSLPARGAWVEIKTFYMRAIPIAGHSPHGERGLKSLWPA